MDTIFSGIHWSPYCLLLRLGSGAESVAALNTRGHVVQGLVTGAVSRVFMLFPVREDKTKDQ